MSRDEDQALREALADYAHDAWSNWMRYLFEKADAGPDGSIIIPSAYAAALRRQMETPYHELTEAEQNSDREEADCILAIVRNVR